MHIATPDGAGHFSRIADAVASERMPEAYMRTRGTLGGGGGPPSCPAPRAFPMRAAAVR